MQSSLALGCLFVLAAAIIIVMLLWAFVNEGRPCFVAQHYSKTTIHSGALFYSYVAFKRLIFTMQ